jgi:hypothetical protein
MTWSRSSTVGCWWPPTLSAALRGSGLMPSRAGCSCGRGGPAAATAGPMVLRMADYTGAVSFAGAMYKAGPAWARRQVEVSIVAGSVQLAPGGKVVRLHLIRHDRVKEHSAFAVPGGRPRKPTPAVTGPSGGPVQSASGVRGVKAETIARSALTPHAAPGAPPLGEPPTTEETRPPGTASNLTGHRSPVARVAGP